MKNLNYNSRNENNLRWIQDYINKETFNKSWTLKTEEDLINKEIEGIEFQLRELEYELLANKVFDKNTQYGILTNQFYRQLKEIDQLIVALEYANQKQSLDLIKKINTKILRLKYRLNLFSNILN